MLASPLEWLDVGQESSLEKAAQKWAPGRRSQLKQRGGGENLVEDRREFYSIWRKKSSAKEKLAERRLGQGKWTDGK